MLWRSRPRAASAIWLLWVTTLVAAEGVLCAQLAREPEPLPQPLQCVLVRSDRWNLLPGLEFTGRLRIDLAPGSGGSLTLIVGDSLPLDIEVESTGGTVPLSVKPIAPELAPPDYWLEFGNPWLAPVEIVSATLSALPERPRTLTLNLGRRAPRVLARIAGYPIDTRARVCAAQSPARHAFSNGRQMSIPPARGEYFASGWYDVERAPGSTGTVRWMHEYGALLIPSSRDGDVRVRLQATPAADENEAEGPTIKMTVNDVFESTPVTMSPGMRSYEWVVPARSWVVGTNEVLFRVSPIRQPEGTRNSERRALGLALQRLDLRLAH